MFQALKNTLLLLKDRKKTVVILIISTFFIVSLLLLEPIFFRYVIDTILTLGTIGSSSGQADTLWRTLIIW